MTSSKIKSRKSPEQRKAEADALQASIAAQAEQLRDSNQWKAFLAFAGSLHNYSLNNLLLIHAQRPDATAVAGFRALQSRGRQVRRGERAIKIRGFAQKQVAADAEAAADESRRCFPADPIDPDAAEIEISPRLRAED